LTPSERKYHIVYVTLLVFIDASENLVMADDVAMPSNPPISLVKKEKLKEAPLDMNVSQRSRKEEPFRKVVCTRIDRSEWDRQFIS
jgi:hypothetical protein